MILHATFTWHVVEDNNQGATQKHGSCAHRTRRLALSNSRFIWRRALRKALGVTTPHTEKKHFREGVYQTARPAGPFRSRALYLGPVFCTQKRGLYLESYAPTSSFPHIPPLQKTPYRLRSTAGKIFRACASMRRQLTL